MTNGFDGTKAATLLGETDLTNISKLGEGNFTLRLTVENETINNQPKKNVEYIIKRKQLIYINLI